MTNEIETIKGKECKECENNEVHGHCTECGEQVQPIMRCKCDFRKPMTNEIKTILKELKDFSEKIRQNTWVFEDESKLTEFHIKEYESFISSHLTELIQGVIEEIEGEKKETWAYGGGGGIDTEFWCKNGISFRIPGIKQIVTYGIKNDAWWIQYLMKWHVILPEKYRDEGFNEGLNLAQEKLRAKLKE